MKKSILIGLLACLYLSVKAQHNENEKSINDSIPQVNGAYEYQAVVPLDSSYKKLDLYHNAKLYFVDNYKSAKDVIQYDDKDQGKIIGKGLMQLSDYNSPLGLTIIPFDWTVSYSTEITCKDGKYRYRMYDISISQTTGYTGGAYNLTMNIDEAKKYTVSGHNKKVTTRLYNYMTKRFKGNVETILAYMIKKQSGTKDDF